MKEIKEWGFCMDITLDQYDSGLESQAHGIGFYCHNYESDESKLDGVYIMNKKSIRIGLPIAEEPSHTTTHTNP